MLMSGAILIIIIIIILNHVQQKNERGVERMFLTRRSSMAPRMYMAPA